MGDRECVCVGGGVAFTDPCADKEEEEEEVWVSVRLVFCIYSEQEKKKAEEEEKAIGFGCERAIMSRLPNCTRRASE